ncbi:RagB/SusD family nutrient uptake outer membrane protein [Pedobacter heparinus]|uniref:RagB/SusD family nutrient uptake outer membrane protein n=1 Tax=Pedobacter heparinus TaxID=984 RepID=UPI00293058EF|nr:RagB/SusD family nutrient uptake outer membrane protein [Pedobacter heparinus]
MKKNHIISGLLLIILLQLSACSKLIEIDSPKSQLTSDKVFADTTSAKSALLNIYLVLENQQYNTSNRYLSVYADESINSSNEQWNQSRLTATEGTIRANWTSLYNSIYQCNMILEQLNIASKLPEIFKSKINAEARFLRAYCYFYLLNLYGSIPLITTTNVDINRQAQQIAQAKVYEQIISDLTIARLNLDLAYQGAGKIRANKACATALLARAYLYQSNWAFAESMADELINSGTYTPLEAPANVFKAGSRESILQFATINGFVTEASSVVPASATVATSFFFTDQFYQSFEAADLRKSSWIGTNIATSGGISTIYRYPAKYKNRVANTTNPENLVVLRIAEQYLIRAEARAQQGKLTGANSAVSDLNLIRSRAGLDNISPSTLSTVLGAIYAERRHEMFFENSDRFIDLKRTGNLQSVMAVAKPTWLATSAVLPIPLGDITTNSKLIQNEGY